MKKQLREELVALAEKILQTKQGEHPSSLELKTLAQQLYEKLTVLHFTESALSGAPVSEKSAPVTEKNPTEEAIPLPQSSSFEFPEEEHDEHAPDGTQYNQEEGLMEPNTEKIKDIVAQMPPEAQEVDDMLEYILPRKFMKNDMEEIGGVHYDHLPQFEPLNPRPPVPEKRKPAEPEKPRRSQEKEQEPKTSPSPSHEPQRPNPFESERPKSINDRQKKGIQIGINDRIAFVRHLFEGSNADYDRVLSQLNTIKSRKEAVDFVQQMVKPDYNNWDGKEEYEHRFLNIVENRFD